jgi:predicted RNase H-like nuclease (RuvC/YqgF family)
MFEVVNIVQVLSGALLGVLGYFGASKIRKSDAKEKESNALQSIQKVYDTFTAHTATQIEQFKTELKHTRRELADIKDEVKVLNKDNRGLHVEISNLHKTNNILKDRIFELEKDNNRKAKENLELKAKLQKLAG